jgi:hypothetical protein
MSLEDEVLLLRVRERNEKNKQKRAKKEGKN